MVYSRCIEASGGERSAARVGELGKAYWQRSGYRGSNQGQFAPDSAQVMLWLIGG